MADPTRPLPLADEADSQHFWSETKNGRMVYQQCSSCEKVIFFPRRHCTGCTAGSLEWKVASGLGTVYTYSIVRQSYHPFFRNQVPYVVAWIDLDEGPRLLSNVVDIDVGEVAIGQRVRVKWEEHAELSVPLFAPA